VAVPVNGLYRKINDDGANGGFMATVGITGGNTFQVATPEGKVLGSFHLNGVHGGGFAEFGAAFEKWKALPEAERKPGALKGPAPAEPSEEAPPKPPPEGLVVRVYMRNLKRDAGGALARITREDVKDRKAFPDVDWEWADAIYTEPMPDVLWLTKAEWKSLVPASPRKGDTYEVPSQLRRRIFAFHLVNGTFGLAYCWGYRRSGSLTLTVEEVSPLLRMRLDGAALLGTNEDPAKGSGFDARLTGSLVYDPKKDAFSRFDFVAVGDYWGGDMNSGRFVRPGRTPLGIAFELADGRSPTDLVPPKGNHFWKEVSPHYFNPHPGD
jgi:hypothetical protein